MKKAIFVFVSIFLISLSCEDNSEIPLGKQLAKKYCTTCHAYPEPALLNTESWDKYILPRMGFMLGVPELVSQEELQRDISPLLKPSESIVNDSEWSTIKEFYLNGSPEVLAYPKVNYSKTDLFEILAPQVKFSPPSTTYVNSQDGLIQMADAHTRSMNQFDLNGQMVSAAKVGEGATHFYEDEDDIWINVMGSFSPVDSESGYILKLAKGQKSTPKKVLTNLNRPVNASYGDLDGDGLLDIVVSEFGKWHGMLSVAWGQQDGAFQKETVINQTGAIKTYLKDWDNDGQLDIISLFGQGKEEIVLFDQISPRKFESTNLITFSPSHGSSSFHFVDYDDDGDEDILYAAGDNADFPAIIKPYHGIYLYENEKGRFDQKFFEFIPGAYDAKMGDFDFDGDLDIAAVSFFPDFSVAGSGFIFLENSGDFKFEHNTLVPHSLGRWIVMNADDIDRDGDEDIVLGSLAFEAPGFESMVSNWVENAIPYLILRNRAKD